MDNPAIHKTGGGFSLAALVVGLTAIALCAIIPQLDANRRMAYERSRLAADFDQINRQTAMNESFLAKMDSDPQLAQRIAQRQMNVIRQGESLLPYKSPKNIDAAAAADVSPYSLTAVPPPPALPAYQPPAGILGAWLLDPHIRLYCLAGGFFLVAAGLVLGSNDAHAQGLSA